MGNLGRHAGTFPRLARVGPGFAGVLLSIALSLAIVCGFAHANGRYFYCEAMGLMATDPCATPAHGRERSGNPPAEAGPGDADCCQIVTLPSLPEGTAAPSSAVPPAPLVGVFAPALADRRLRAPGTLPALAHAPWRSPPRSAAQARARAQLMVFLT